MPAKQRLLIIDSNALIHRSYHALPPLTDSRGRPTQAVYGFATTLLKAWKELKPTHIVACFDMKGPTFREQEYKEYKATRVKAPDDLYEQIPLTHELVEAFHIPIYEKATFEADDLIGTITQQEPKIEKIIVTGDMDSMQLVDAHTKVYTLRKGMSDTAIFDEAAVEERYGLTPEQVIDYKALRGDPSDNIPGVKGIGEKTATDLLKEFKSLEALYKALADETPKAQKLKDNVKEKLIKFKSDAFLSQKLATIKRDVPIDFDLNDAAVKNYDRQKVVGMLQDFGFKSLLNKLPEVDAKAAREARQAALILDTSVPDKPGHEYTLINDETTFQKFLGELKQQVAFAIDTETTALKPHDAKLLGMSFSWKNGTGYYVVAKDEFVQELRPILENPKIAKYGHHLKYDGEIFKLHGVDLQPFSFDTMIASYVLNPGTRQHSLDALAFSEFGYEMMPIEALIGPKGKKQMSMEDVAVEKIAWYASEDADFTWRLAEKFLPKIKKEGFMGLMESLELPLIPVLMDMELTGVKIDTDYLAEMAKTAKKDLKKIEDKIYDLAGTQFNISSPMQLKEILFEKLKIETRGIGRTKTGLSTAADQLEKLKDAHPIIPLIGQYRELSKLISTYLDALPELVHPKTGRVHTSYNQTVAATGRLSSTDPNLQNIPIRTELGAKIRNAFIADRGNRLIAADYSQIELRIIASMAKDQAMMDAFNNGEDIHARTAANINDVPLDQVTKQMRRAAKAVNFGIIYGLGYVGLAQGEGISRDEARAFIEKYFTIHKNIKAWIDNTKKLAHDNGFVETLFGRKRYFPEINSSNGMLVAAAERQAINAPIQGTAADLMKLAMIHVYDQLPSISKDAKLLMQVHDELIIEAPMHQAEAVAKFLKHTMESVYTLNVPIEVEVGIGKNWGEAK